MSDEAIIDNMRASVIRHAIGPTILLGSGTYFDFENPEGSDITIEDVAYGLAFEGRCAGQCYSRILKRRVFYSVAEHCVRMSHAVPKSLALEALLHEAGEAVCGDMTAPLKSLNPAFKAIEKRCEAAILAKFGVTIRDPLEIKKADLRMLATERRDLLPWKGERWSIADDHQPYDFEIVPWPPEAAALAFLSRYHVLAADLEAETCEACDIAFKDGDMVYWRSDDSGYIHADCCGPERESYVNADGEPLKDGEPIPQPFAWRADRG